MATASQPEFEFYFAAALHNARKEAGLKQEELALRVGTHASEISTHESGRRSPQVGTVKRLADGLGIPSWKLMWLAEQLESGAPWEEIAWPPPD